MIIVFKTIILPPFLHVNIICIRILECYFKAIIFPPVLHYSEAPWCHAVDTPVSDALFVKKYVMIVVTVIITLCLCHIILAFYRNYYFVLYKEY